MRFPNFLKDVRKFHEKFGFPHPNKPALPPDKEMSFRLSLVEEEFEELKEAIEEKDLVEIVDALVDIIYVCVGTLVSCGVNLTPIWNEVQDTNIKKEGGDYYKGEKLLKPEGWIPPRIKELLKEQGWEREENIVNSE